MKKGKERSIPIDKETEKYYKIAIEGSYRDDTISSKFREILRKLDLYETKHGDKRNFHSLRSTFAVRKFYEINSIYRVRVLSGHSSVKTTEKYAEFDMDELENDFDIEDEEEESEKDEKKDRKSRDFSSGISDRDSQRLYGVS